MTAYENNLARSRERKSCADPWHERTKVTKKNAPGDHPYDSDVELLQALLKRKIAIDRQENVEVIAGDFEQLAVL
jgi:hypothetical protein